jgi:quinone-modifying oxidoreductase subunit QmoC
MEPDIQINPDKRFIRQLKAMSRAPLKECMQCGSCSVVCKLASEERPFPRKEMIWASWGIKEKLLGNPDLWLCHQCGDCTVTCPRGVQPSVILAALRQINYLEYSTPRFLARWLGNPAFLPVIIAIPALIILLILWLAGTHSLPDGPVDYSKFFPHAVLNGSFSALVVLVLLSFTFGFLRFLKDVKKQLPAKSDRIPVKWMYIIRDVILHRQFIQCVTPKARTIAHLLIFFGFIILLFVTVVAIVNVLFFDYPMAFWHPAKIAGNLAGLMLIIGTLTLMYQRLFRKNTLGKSTYSDWSFLFFLLLLTVSGILTEWARFGNWSAAYVIYFIHLVLVWMVVIYAPYTKFGHFIYRLAVLFLTREKE